MTSGAEKRAILQAGAAPLGVDEFGPTLVVAPHPDDESLGAGGTLALLRRAGTPAHVLFVSDGTQSHPNSPTYPAERLRALREAEALDALRELGLDETAATFLRLPDTRVPLPDAEGFAEAVSRIVAVLDAFQPATVLVPWRRDPHRDHRATWHLVQTARERTTAPARYLEYPIWLWELGQPDDWPRPGEVRVWRVAVGEVLDSKRRAIAAHRSQVTRLIDDDPAGFYLSSELISYFDEPDEILFES
jgi:LmbE family N-acetylglucosaminyl deacetylase